MQPTKGTHPTHYVYQVETPVVNFSTQKDNDLNSQTLFTKDLWEKIAPSTKKYLVENAFVFPMGLAGNYRCFDIDGDPIVIDFDTSLGNGRIAKIRFGQNLKTKEFLAFKAIDYDTDTIDENNQEVVAMRNLKRLRGLIFDEQEKIVYMAMELVNGVTLSEYYWPEHSNDVVHAIKLAIAYLDELEFVAESKVSQSDKNPGNKMIDLKRNKVFLVDFAGHSSYNYKTASFYPEPLFPFINIIDLNTVIKLLPYPHQLQTREILTESYKQFYSSLVKIKETGERKEKNGLYFEITIEDLRTKLYQFIRVCCYTHRK